MWLIGNGGCAVEMVLVFHNFELQRSPEITAAIPYSSSTTLVIDFHRFQSLSDRVVLVKILCGLVVLLIEHSPNNSGQVSRVRRSHIAPRRLRKIVSRPSFCHYVAPTIHSLIFVAW
jgi:hypothetical protein